MLISEVIQTADGTRICTQALTALVLFEGADNVTGWKAEPGLGRYKPAGRDVSGRVSGRKHHTNTGGNTTHTARGSIQECMSITETHRNPREFGRSWQWEGNNQSLFELGGKRPQSQPLSKRVHSQRVSLSFSDLPLLSFNSCPLRTGPPQHAPVHTCPFKIRPAFKFQILSA